MPASRFDQLHRDIIINSEIHGGVKKPKILGAGYGFKGINGIPGLLSSEDIENATQLAQPLVQLCGIRFIAHTITDQLIQQAIDAGKNPEVIEYMQQQKGIRAVGITNKPKP